MSSSLPLSAVPVASPSQARTAIAATASPSCAAQGSPCAPLGAGGLANVRVPTTRQRTRHSGSSSSPATHADLGAGIAGAGADDAKSAGKEVFDSRSACSPAASLESASGVGAPGRALPERAKSARIAGSTRARAHGSTSEPASRAARTALAAAKSTAASLQAEPAPAGSNARCVARRCSSPHLAFRPDTASRVRTPACPRHDAPGAWPSALTSPERASPWRLA
mmetsp:Transcript_24900/g.94155  ORF Transcript_24900/g.94155 Transcript_24900/m.94155 type:complete len:224 (-) Transcript_24900:920-1591(-)